MSNDSGHLQSAATLTNADLVNTTQQSRGRYFFVVMACLFPIVAVVGFTPSYRDFQSGEAQLHWFAHVHGAIMSSWLIIFIAQTILAAKGIFKFHRRLGFFSIGLGTAVWLCMGIATVRALIAYSPPLEDFLWDILLIQLYAMNLFGLFFVWGILVRKKTDAHKRLLFLATLVLLQAAIDRMPFLPGLFSTLYIRYIYLDALIVPLFIYDLVTIGRIHKITIIGSVIIVVSQFMVTMMWGSIPLHQFWFNRLAPFVEQVVEVKLNDEQIKPLLGDYGDEHWKMTISQNAGKVYLKLPDTPEFEMGSTSENEWFLRTIAWRVSFIRGPDGSVVKIVNKQPSNTWEVKRFK